MFANIVALLAVPLFAQSVIAQGQTCTRTYTVQAGDICDGISTANSVSTYQLAVVNDGIIDPQCDNLQPGESICLGWQGEDCTTTHTVQLGEDCDGIASANGINATILYANNPQIDPQCDNIYGGEVLCVASSVIVPPAPNGTVPATTIPATATAANTDLPYCDEL